MRSRLIRALPLAAFVALLVLLPSACSPSDAASRRELASLSLEAKAAQVLLIGVEGSGSPSAGSLELLEKLSVGGVLLFGSNLPAKAVDLGAYTAALQAAAARGGGPSLIIAIDHEGGSVFRFKGGDVTRIPAAATVGELPAPSAARYAEALGRAAGSELSALGVNMALAPVVELLNDRNEAFLDTRSYGRDPAIVDAAAGGYIRGLQESGVAAVAKHFPGNAAEDPHLSLPRLELGRGELERDCLPRFAGAARSGVSAVMLSHVLCPQIDPDLPSSLSPVAVGGLLRKRIGFRGLAITDDLCMRALTGTRSPERSAILALSAGADLLMVVDMDRALRVRDAIVEAVRSGGLSAKRLDEAALRVLQVKRRFHINETLDRAAKAATLAAFADLVEADRRSVAAALAKETVNKGAKRADHQ
jgi:Beta-glucosidase-related glycosidases